MTFHLASTLPVRLICLVISAAVFAPCFPIHKRAEASSNSAVFRTGIAAEEMPALNSSSSPMSGAASAPPGVMSPPTPGTTRFDFDGDGKADIGIWRPSSGTWLIIRSSNSQTLSLQLGVSTDQIVPADYDGDHKTDAAVWRPSTGVWYIMNPDLTVRTVSWGSQGDIPVPADYDADGKADVAVYRPTEGTWYIINSFDSTIRTVGWGIVGDRPVPADFDGDHFTDIAVFRPSDGNWHIKRSLSGQDFVKNWGVLGDIPAPANYDPDPKDDYAVWRPTNSGWYIVSTSDNGEEQAYTWGASSDTPVPADYDGDGRADIATYRPIGQSTGTWYIRNSSDGSTRIVGWGTIGDVPIPRVAGAQTPPPGPTPNNLSSALADPINRTGGQGEDLFSGNFNSSLPILSLAGRAGMDLGLSLSYNSLVWTRQGSTITFNADNGFPAPGFHLGFPSIQSQVYVSQSGSNALLMITPSGGRVELRQVSTNLYESADSSYLQLNTGTNPITLRTRDGAQLSFQLLNGEYRCSEVKDSNGNYITVNRDGGSGRINTITDTLARTITFAYANNNLQKVTQPWNGAEHIWAEFEYSSLAIQTSFTGLSVVGPQNGTSITVLHKVTLDDGSSFDFEYTSYGQIKKINHKAEDNHLLGYTAYDMSTSTGQTDCPRFTKRTDYAENWNTVDTLFTFDRGTTGFGQVTTPDGTVVKEYHALSGFAKGLAMQTETFSSDNLNTPKKTNAVIWTQNDETLPYPKNPRVIETRVTDEVSNVRRVTIAYSSFTLPSGTICKLPSDTLEYAANGTTVLRKTHTDYLMTTAYLNQQIIGLPSARYLYDSDSQTATPLSKVTFGYDAGSSMTGQGEPVQHASGYGTGFLTRGNLTSVTRWDVTTLGGSPQSVTSTMGYNTVGDLISTSDPLGHQVTISYTDSFAATNTTLPGSTLAYPTTVTDPDSYSATTQVDYDLGAAKVTTDAKGAIQTTTYDGAGRVSRVDISNGFYTRYVYPVSQTQIDTYSLIQTGGAEFYSTQLLDGAGRVRATRSSFPGSTGGYRGQLFVYDVMGRVVQQSNPTEITSSSIPAGDDAAAGWLYTLQEYDWNGRPTWTTNTDGSTRTITYGGCGCSGGNEVTIRDEVNRRQRMTYDVLGRLVKTESLNPNLSTYATRTDTYNARDQITRIFVQGMSGPGQETLMTYDGHGRLVTRKTPIEGTAGTTYAYYADDTVQRVTDARGAFSTYTYNGRHLIRNIAYTRPSVEGNAIENVADTPPVEIQYDAGGNRLWMTDGPGRVDYVFDTWSRLRSETRYFTELLASYALLYDYNLAGGLKKLRDPFGAEINYVFNDAGQITSATGTGFGSVSQFASGMQYRAWGGLKHGLCGGNGNVDLSYNGRLLMTRYTSPITGSDYQYYADGRVSFASNLLNNEFDRAYSYDHLGRLTQGLTGKEARGETGVDGPYRQSYQYDVWDNLVARTNRFWTQLDDVFTASYTNDRNPAWTYDDAGNIRLDTMNHKYDVVSRQTNGYFGEVFGILQSYDGDSQPAKRVETRIGWGNTVYYVRSSVLGGQPVTQLRTTTNGANGHQTRVYLNGEESAVYDTFTNSVSWTMRNPVTGRGVTWPIGVLESDPLGGYVGTLDPFIQDPNATYESIHFNAPLYLEDGNPFDPGSGCTLDGIPISCSLAAGKVANGSAALAPLRSTIPVQYAGQVTLASFRAFADGYQGYVPGNAKYIGKGQIQSINPPKLFRRGSLAGDTDLARLNGSGDPELALARSTGFANVGSHGAIRVGFQSGNQAKATNERSECGTGAVEVIIWDGSFAHINSILGHMTYVIDGTNYSWESNGRFNRTTPAKDYIDSNRKWRNGTGFVLDFGDYNSAFATAIKNGYGYPSPTSGYNSVTNNCGDAFCRVTKAWSIANRLARDGRLSSLDGPPILHVDACITPACHESYIRNHLKDYTCQVNHYVWP